MLFIMRKISFIMLFFISLNTLHAVDIDHVPPLKTTTIAYDEKISNYPDFSSIYPYLILPITGAVRGAMASYTHGHTAKLMMLGTLLGVLDEAALYSEYVSTLIFTPAFIGGTIPLLSTLGGPYGMAGGALFGIIYAHGFFSTFEDYVGDPAWGGVIGYQAYGTQGAAIGAGIGLVDQGLKALNYISESHLSEIFKKALLTKFLFGPWAPLAISKISSVPMLGQLATATSSLPFIEFALPVALKGYTLAHTKNETETKRSFNLKDLKEKYGALYADHPETQQHIQRASAAFITMDQAINAIFFVLLDKIQVMRLAVEQLNTEEQHSALSNFNKGFEAFLLVNFYHVSSYFASAFLQAPLQTLLISHVPDQFFASLLDEESLVGLNGDPDVKTPLSKFNSDIQKLRSHMTLLTEGTTMSLKGLDAFSVLIKKNALDIALTLEAYNDLKTFITTYLANINYQYQSELRVLEGEIAELTTTLISDPEGMYLSGTKKLVEEKLTYKRQLSLAIENNQLFIQNLSDSWDRLTGYFGWIYSMKITAQSIADKKLQYKDYFSIVVGSDNYLEAQDWSNKNSGKISEALQTLDSLDKINIALKKVEVKPYKTLEREIITSGTHFKMILEPSRIGIGSDLKIETDEPITFLPGWYAFTGDSGSGKSTLLKKLFGLKKDAVWAEGKVIFETSDGQDPSIIMVTQSDVIAPSITLLEYLCNCSLDNASSEKIDALHDQVIPVLKALRFSDKLLESSDWQTERDFLMQKIGQGDGKLSPSGGQKKKMGIARVLTQNPIPKILFFDEIFVGLDAAILLEAHRLLKERLKGSIIIVVDHQALPNQALAHTAEEVFYDKRIHLNIKTKKLLLGDLEDF